MLTLLINRLLMAGTYRTHIALLFAAWLVTACSSVTAPSDQEKEVPVEAVSPVVVPIAREAGEPTLETLQAIAQQHPNLASPWVKMGQLALQRGDEATARTWLAEAMERNPQDCHAYVQLGLLERQVLNFAAAENHYQSCIDRDPTFAAAHLNLGILYEIYLGSPSLALASYERYQALNHEKRVERWIALITSTLAARDRLLAENEP